jgi:hypothetical protein
MAARLQAATSSDGPMLLRIESGGHGVGQSLDQEIGIETDVLAFVTNRLGVDTTDREDACIANHPYVDGRLCFSDAASR